MTTNGRNQRTTWADVHRWAGLAHRMGVAVIATDLAGEVCVWNRSAEVLYGWLSDEVVGAPIMELTVGPSEASIAQDVMGKVLSGAAWEGDFTAVTRNGDPIEVHVLDAPVYDAASGQLTGVLGLSVESARLGTGVMQEIAQLRRHNQAATRAVEAERIRVARELHDELGQYLTALRTEVLWWHSKAEGESAESAERAERAVNAALVSLRRIVDELHPRVLDQLGVCDAIESLANDFTARTRVASKVVIDHEHLGWVVNDVELTLFRITQECLTNIERHAVKVAHVCIELLRDHAGTSADSLVLRITNDGAPYSGAIGFGIRSMMDRAAAHGGRLTMVSRDSGVVAETRIPAAIAFEDHESNGTT